MTVLVYPGVRLQIFKTIMDDGRVHVECRSDLGATGAFYYSEQDADSFIKEVIKEDKEVDKAVKKYSKKTRKDYYGYKKREEPLW